MTGTVNLTGQTLGQYKIVEQIGQGGMATVFKAYQPGLNRDVAIKVLPPYVAEKPGFTERFSREAQAIGSLHHPNILPVYDFGQDKGYGYIVMRYIPNAKTLANMMTGKLNPGQITQITTQLAAALDHAHKAGIIHRDIKPSNVLMDGDWVLLSDFGLAKMVEDSQELTGAGIGLGTPAYMSPEQAKGEKIDQRTDIYALGIIVFEMLTGQVPHKAETPLATVVKRINEPLPSPRNLNPAIPDAVEQTLLKALAKTPEQRYQSAGEFANTLKTAFAQQPVRVAMAVSRQGSPAAVPLPPPVPDIQVTPPQPSGAITPVEIALMTTLALVSLCGLGGVVLALTTDSSSGEANFALAPACLGLTFAGLTSTLMIWQRNRNRHASAWLAMGIILWFIGINILGWGGFTVMSPGDNTVLENLGYSLVLCFGPGAVLAALGIIAYGYDWRQGRRAAKVAKLQAVQSTAPKTIDNKLQRAAEYRKHINKLIEQKKGTPFADQLAPLTLKLNQWETRIKELVKRVHNFEKNPLIQRDMQEVPLTIARLQAQLGSENNPQVRQEIEEAITRYQAHQKELDALSTLIRKTELDIDETLAAIGAIYSQLQLLDAKQVDGKRASRISEDVEEQARRLGDLLEAMDEVYESTVNLSE